uniref:Uncharacterized protein n=1 Tax=Anguilla anguilla TaxID=7936 RepID=A0A0E9WRD6_ANGAN
MPYIRNIGKCLEYCESTLHDLIATTCILKSNRPRITFDQSISAIPEIKPVQQHA